MTNAAPADHAAPELTARRALLGAGLVGAALATLGAERAAAAATEPPGDTATAEFVIGIELAARNLYDAAIAAGASDDLWSVIREQHEGAAQLLSGIVGVSANTANETLLGDHLAAFGVADPSQPGFELENTLAATHTALIGSVTTVEVAQALASIAALESRQAAVLGLRVGVSGDDLLIDSASVVEGN